MSIAFAIPWLVAAQVTAGQPATPSAPAPPDQKALEKEFQDSLAKDAAAKAQAQGSATTAAPAQTQSPAPPPAAIGGGGNISNPEISVIGSFAAVARRDGDVAPTFKAGDDAPAQGVAVQELELSFAADVDPYFRMFAFLTMSDTETVEIEEAFLTTTALPRGFLFKGGDFRSAFGRNNEQHLHVQDFGRRPKTTQLLGDDGLRAPGAQLSYLLPTPWYATILVEYLGLNQDPSATLELEQFFDISRSWSLLWGLSSATLQRGAPDPTDLVPMPAKPDREFLLGTDVYLKWRPPNEADTYFWVGVTAEYIASRTENKDWDGAGYGQVVAQVARRLRAGVRLDFVGFPSTALGRELDASASLAFLPTEFSRIRLTYAHDHPLDNGSLRNDYLILQLEGTIGAHGAHPF